MLWNKCYCTASFQGSVDDDQKQDSNVKQTHRLVSVKMKGNDNNMLGRNQRGINCINLKEAMTMALMESSSHSCKLCKASYTNGKRHNQIRGGSRISTVDKYNYTQISRLICRKIYGNLFIFSLLFMVLALIVLGSWPSWLVFSDQKVNNQMQTHVSLPPALVTEVGNAYIVKSGDSGRLASSSLLKPPTIYRPWAMKTRSFRSLEFTHEQARTLRSKPKVTAMKKSLKSSSYSHGVIDNMSSINPLGLSDPDLKIYVYDLPSIFNNVWLVQKDKRCSNHLFAAEVAIHHRLLESPVRTMEPSEADFFFMPVYVSCNFNTTSGFPSLSHARALLASAVKHVSLEMPYWNHSNGQDHVFVATHDYGPCFHTMEDFAVAAGIPSFLRSSVILQTFGRTDGHVCQANNHIHIPPFVQPPNISNYSSWRSDLQRRDIWAYFRGKMEINPKNVSGRIYSRGIRSTIWHKFRRNRKFFIKRTRTSDYYSELRRSVFCLCPLGWAPWSPRIVESVISGCVPVIIADMIALPFPHAINWSQISVTVAEKDVDKLGKILEKVAHTNLTTIQKNLWNEPYRRALLYTDPLANGDATWQIFELLSRKLRDSKATKLHRRQKQKIHDGSEMEDRWMNPISEI